MRKLFLSAAISACFAMGVSATLYTDTTGDAAFGISVVDIVSVEVTHDATDVNFKITVDSDIDTPDPMGTDWGKYLIGIDSTAGGDPTGNGWARPISMTSGMDYWIGSWVNAHPANGAQVWSWTGATWSEDFSTTAGDPEIGVTDAGTMINISIAQSALGLSNGDTFIFDVFSSGGGATDSAVDALSDPTTTIADWPDAYASGSQLSYTIPEPSTYALIAFGVLGLASRRLVRRKK